MNVYTNHQNSSAMERRAFNKLRKKKKKKPTKKHTKNYTVIKPSDKGVSDCHSI